MADASSFCERGWGVTFTHKTPGAMRRSQALCPTLAPRGLHRPDAATYVGVSPAKFDQWVERGIMPKPKRQDSVVVWDRLSLDAAFLDLPGDDNGEDDVWRAFDDKYKSKTHSA
jgi:hypothetical protein